MRVLLDTHVAIWAVQGEPMSDAARTAIVTAKEIVVSVVTPWEVVIKAALGKITLSGPVETLTRELQREFGARLLPVTLPHVLQVGALPMHHGDPFDRLLIAQARVEGLTIVTRDGHFSSYDVATVHA